MGLTGSVTSKATVNEHLKPFTTWGEDELNLMLQRNRIELTDTFALRFHEFEKLLGKETA
jgi:hypothetical protein